MKRYGNLYPKLCSMDNLQFAHQCAKRGKGWYRDVQMVESNPEYYLKQLQDMLVNHTYLTSPYVKFEKKERGKVREIYKLPYYPDRIGQWAGVNVIEPYLIRSMVSTTYSAIPGRGIHAALHDVQKAMENRDECEYCLKLDVRHYYQSIDHDVLKALYRHLFKDPELLWWIDEIIDSISTGEQEGVGIPIGNFMSQYSGNYYLTPFDHWIKEEKRVKHYFRYMDDIVIFGPDKQQLHTLFDEIRTKLHDELHLKVKDNWQIFPTYVRGLDFVGYRIFDGYTLLRKSTCEDMKKRLARISVKTQRGQLMNYSDWCAINSYKGWLKHCDSYRLYQKYITPLEADADRYYREVVLKKGREKHEKLGNDIQQSEAG